MKDEYQTFIERFNSADEEEQKKITRLINGAGYADGRIGQALVDKKRKNLAETISVGDIDETEAMSLIKDREDDFLEEFNIDGLPEWVLRIEAQDVIMQLFLHKMEEEGLLD